MHCINAHSLPHHLSSYPPQEVSQRRNTTVQQPHSHAEFNKGGFIAPQKSVLIIMLPLLSGLSIMCLQTYSKQIHGQLQSLGGGGTRPTGAIETTGAAGAPGARGATGAPAERELTPPNPPSSGATPWPRPLHPVVPAGGGHPPSRRPRPRCGRRARPVRRGTAHLLRPAP